MDANINYTLIIQSFPKYLWYGMWLTLSTVLVVYCGNLWQCWKNALRITERNLLPHMISAPVLYYIFYPIQYKCLWNKNTKYKSISTYTTQNISTHESSNTHFFVIDGPMIYIMYTTRYLSFTIFILQLWRVVLQLDHTSTGNHSLCYQGEDYWYDFNTKLLEG